GMRIQKEGSQGVVRYTYDDGSVLLQTDDAGATLAKYDYGPDRLLSLEQATEGEQFYHFDALGSVVNLSKPDGSLQARYQYDAWGNERVTTGSSWNRFAFTGHEKDEETGLYYFKARFYDPQLGRFLSQDAYLGEDNTPPSLHRYLYAYANPTVYIDLDGYEATTVRPGMGPAGLIPGMAQGHWQADYDENGKTVGQEALAPVIEFVEGAWSGAKNLAEIAAKKWIESNVLPYIVTEDSGPTILTTPIHENEPTVLTTPIHENEPTVLTTPIQETGPTTYTTPIQENGPTVYVTPDQSDLIDSGPMLNVRTGQDRDHVTYRGTKIDPVTGVAKPYTGYASAPSSEGLSAAEIVLRRYRGNFDDFGGVAPDVTYSGSDVGGKQTARGLEQHNYEQDVKKYGKENVSNKQNPVGQKNPNRDAYSEAAKRELNL
ncbi:MAG: RHS repeat-associated core domain-containing protein, partial [Candidatus Thiodiazotropha sp. (ex Lucinoma borealis)]|nr:RHS repeat-associated core domain-containing protein [Candidatus Thiodiazotropha sp. (ex Lucinoma borealis)]